MLSKNSGSGPANEEKSPEIKASQNNNAPQESKYLTKETTLAGTFITAVGAVGSVVATPATGAAAAGIAALGVAAVKAVRDGKLTEAKNLIVDTVNKGITAGSEAITNGLNAGSSALNGLTQYLPSLNIFSQSKKADAPSPAVAPTAVAPAEDIKPVTPIKEVTPNAEQLGKLNSAIQELTTAIQNSLTTIENCLIALNHKNDAKNPDYKAPVNSTSATANRLNEIKREFNALSTQLNDKKNDVQASFIEKVSKLKVAGDETIRLINKLHSAIKYFPKQGYMLVTTLTSSNIKNVTHKNNEFHEDLHLPPECHAIQFRPIKANGEKAEPPLLTLKQRRDKDSVEIARDVAGISKIVELSNEQKNELKTSGKLARVYFKHHAKSGDKNADAKYSVEVYAHFKVNIPPLPDATQAEKTRKQLASLEAEVIANYLSQKHLRVENNANPLDIIFAYSELPRPT